MDPLTGLTNMQQRYYDPGIGRFLSVDPVNANASTGDNFNRYAYVDNNPYKFTDPDGRIKKLIWEGLKWVGKKVLPKSAPKTAPKSAPKQSPQTQQPAPRQEPAKPSESPDVKPSDLTGKTRTEIRETAECKGLCAAGDKSHPDYPRKWKDPVTGKERVRLDRGHTDPKTGEPYSNPNAARNHVHGYGRDGQPIRDPVTGDKHFPTVGD